ncbi:hypothetical protein [Halovenus halobia]|uniref:hypothetical protein n=1 Tax=Halovenus halobia TaxID=3396622 RepID=UPI003F5679F7
MNWTAVLHIAFAVFVGAGVLVSQTWLRIGLFTVGALCFVAGVVVARLGDENPDYESGSGA